MENQRRVVQGVQDHSLGYFTGEIPKVVVMYIHISCNCIFPKCLWTPCSSSVHIRKLMGRCTKLGTPLLTSDLTFSYVISGFRHNCENISLQAYHIQIHIF